MKKVLISMIIIALLTISSHAGRVIWTDSGKPTIEGPEGEGCNNNDPFEDKNETGTKC